MIWKVYKAAEEGDIETLRELLKIEDLPINKAIIDDRYPLLCWFSMIGEHEIVRELLKHEKIDVNQVELCQGKNSLGLACLDGHVEVVKLLIQHKDIDINFATEEGYTPLLLSFHGVRSVEIARELLKHEKIDVNKPSKTHSPPLFFASAYGRVEFAKLLLKHEKIDVNYSKKGESALCRSAINGKAPVVQELLKHENIIVDKQAFKEIVKKAIKCEEFHNVLNEIIKDSKITSDIVSEAELNEKELAFFSENIKLYSRKKAPHYNEKKVALKIEDNYHDTDKDDNVEITGDKATTEDI